MSFSAASTTSRRRRLSVPMVSDGEVKGYIIAQFVFTVDGVILRKLSVPPDIFIQR